MITAVPKGIAFFVCPHMVAIDMLDSDSNIIARQLFTRVRSVPAWIFFQKCFSVFFSKIFLIFLKGFLSPPVSIYVSNKELIKKLKFFERKYG